MRNLFNVRFVAAALAGLTICSTGSAADPAGRVLYTGTAEYGWSFKGHASWGGNWQARAQNEAQAQIQRNIASMVNLKQLDTFTKKDHSTSIDTSGQGSAGGGGGKIAYADNMSSAEQTRWVNGNNYLIVVTSVRVKPGTAYEKHDENWKGERTQHYSATMVYQYRIYGPNAGAAAQAEAKFAYTLKNDSGRTVSFRLPSGKDYTLKAGESGSYHFTGDPAKAKIHVYSTGRTYTLRAGTHKLWWMANENRIGLDLNAK